MAILEFATVSLVGLIFIHLIVAGLLGFTNAIASKGSWRFFSAFQPLAGLAIYFSFIAYGKGNETALVAGLGFIFLMTVSAIVFTGVGIKLIHRWLLRRSKRSWILQVAAYPLFAFSFYPAFFPPDSFYIDEFERRTEIELPDSVYVLKKSASYPDFHGDYSSEAIFRLSVNDYNKLASEMPIEKRNEGEGCLVETQYAYMGTGFIPQGCWRREIRMDSRIMVTFFPKEFALHFYYIQT